MATAHKRTLSSSNSGCNDRKRVTTDSAKRCKAVHIFQFHLFLMWIIRKIHDVGSALSIGNGGYQYASYSSMVTDSIMLIKTGIVQSYSN